MKINLQSVKQLAILGLATLVVSCGGGDGAVPTPPKPIPKGLVEGVVMLGPVYGATVVVSKFDKDPTKIVKIAESTQTGSDGSFKIELNRSEAEIPILVCAENGTYEEPAALVGSINTPVKDFKGDKLCAVTSFKAGETKIVNITFFTHVAYGLIKKRITHPGNLLDTIIPGTDKAQPKQKTGIINYSNNLVANWIDIKDIIKTKPVDFKDSNALRASSLDDKYKYGLVNMAVSYLVDWMGSEGTEISEFRRVSSIAFAQLASKDLQDEKLDGRYGQTLNFGQIQALDTHYYRYHFSLGFFAIVGNPELNNVGLDKRQIDAYAVRVGENQGKIFPKIEPRRLVTASPIIQHSAGVDAGRLVSGPTDVTYIITDVTGVDIKDIKLSLKSNGVKLTSYKDQAPDVAKSNIKASRYTWVIDTDTKSSSGKLNRVPDGVYEVEVIATNLKGQLSTKVDPGFKVRNNDLGLIIIKPGSATVNNPDNVFSINAPGVTTTKLPIKVNVVNPFETVNKPTVVKMEIVKFADKSSFNPPQMITPVIALTKIPATGKDFTAELDLAALLQDDQYYLKVTAIADPNTSGSGQIPLIEVPQFLAFARDNKIPTGSITTPVNGSASISKTVYNATTAINIAVGGSLADAPAVISGYASGISAVNLEIVNPATNTIYQGGAIDPPSAKFTHTINGTGWPEGWLYMYLSLSDKAKNHDHTQHINFGYDKTKPIVTVDPNIVKSGQWQRVAAPTHVLSGTAQDKETGLKSIQVSLAAGTSVNLKALPNIQLKTANSEDPKHKHTITHTIKDVFPSIPDGVYKYRIEATDHGGNMGFAEIAQFGIDNTAPTVTINSVTDPSTKPFPVLGSEPTGTPGGYPVTRILDFKLAYNFTAVENGFSTGGMTGTGSGLQKYAITETVSTSGGGQSGALTNGSQTITDSAAKLSVTLPVHQYRLEGANSQSFTVAALCATGEVNDTNPKLCATEAICTATLATTGADTVISAKGTQTVSTVLHQCISIAAITVNPTTPATAIVCPQSVTVSTATDIAGAVDCRSSNGVQVTTGTPTYVAYVPPVCPGITMPIYVQRVINSAAATVGAVDYHLCKTIGAVDVTSLAANTAGSLAINPSFVWTKATGSVSATFNNAVVKIPNISNVTKAERTIKAFDNTATTNAVGNIPVPQVACLKATVSNKDTATSFAPTPPVGSNIPSLDSPAFFSALAANATPTKTSLDSATTTATSKLGKEPASISVYSTTTRTAVTSKLTCSNPNASIAGANPATRACTLISIWKQTADSTYPGQAFLYAQTVVQKNGANPCPQ